MIGALLFLHIVGVAFWLGGLFALGAFTARARRAGDASVLVFAYRTGSVLYRNVVAVGAWITILSGAALVFAGDWGWFRPFPNHWLFQMQVLGLLVFGVTVLYLVPRSGRMAALAERTTREPDRASEFESGVRRQAIVASVTGGVLLYIVLLGAVRF